MAKIKKPIYYLFKKDSEDDNIYDKLIGVDNSFITKKQFQYCVVNKHDVILGYEIEYKSSSKYLCNTSLIDFCYSVLSNFPNFTLADILDTHTVLEFDPNNFKYNSVHLPTLIDAFSEASNMIIEAMKQMEEANFQDFCADATDLIVSLLIDEVSDLVSKSCPSFTIMVRGVGGGDFNADFYREDSILLSKSKAALMRACMAEEDYDMFDGFVGSYGDLAFYSTYLDYFTQQVTEQDELPAFYLVADRENTKNTMHDIYGFYPEAIDCEKDDEDALKAPDGEIFKYKLNRMDAKRLKVAFDKNDDNTKDKFIFRGIDNNDVICNL